MRRIVCLGGEPAGLYAAILLRNALPSGRIEVFERNRPTDTFGWDVVFSDQTMDNFRAPDPQTHSAILSNFHHWDDIAIHFGARRFQPAAPRRQAAGGCGYRDVGVQARDRECYRTEYSFGRRRSYVKDRRWQKTKYQ